MGRVAAVRFMGLYVPVLGAFLLAFLRPRLGRIFPATLLGFVWTLPSLLAVQLLNLHFGWWQFNALGGLFRGMPIDLYLGWAVLWGILPTLAFHETGITSVAAIFFGVDLVLMPACSPVVALNHRWLIGELVALCLVLVPAQLLARWTLNDTHLRVRAVLQVLAAGGVFLFLIPEVVFAMRPGQKWDALLSEPAWLRNLELQAIVLLGISGVSAVQEFVQRGKGTPIPCDPPKQLVTSGLYRYISNPMQLSGVLVMTAWGGVLQNPWLAAAGVMSVLYSLGVAAGDEGEDLEARFGTPWESYRKNVHAWRPRLMPWQSPERQPARLYISETCGPCSEVRSWFESHGATALQLLAAEDHRVGNLQRITYDPMDGTGIEEGVCAFARGLEHINLGWAFAGAFLRLPGISHLVRIFFDASGFGPRLIPRRSCKPPSAIENNEVSCFRDRKLCIDAEALQLKAFGGRINLKEVSVRRRQPFPPPWLAASFLLILSAAPNALRAQDWPPIPPEELAMKQFPASPEAPAVILLRESHTDDVKSFATEHYRIKILKEEGKKYGDVVIPYTEKRTKVEDIRARTVHSDSTAVAFSGQIFDKVVVKSKRLRFQAKTFTLPGVEVGSIIEYSYKIRWRDWAPDVLKNPQNYILRASLSFPTAKWVLTDELFTRRARFSLRPLPNARLEWVSFGMREGMQPQQQPDGTYELSVENIPAFQEEEFSLPEETLKSRVHLFYVLSYAGSPGFYWRDWGRLRAEDSEKFIGKSKSIEREAASLVSPADPPDTKLRKLYARVQQIRDLSYEPEKTGKEEKREQLSENKSAEDVLKHGYARLNEGNFLFVALARAAGFQASPVEVAARYSGRFFQEDLDATQLNANVVWVRVGPQEVYLDPACRFCPYGLLPWFESSTRGVRLETTGGILITTPPIPSEAAVVERRTHLQLQAGGNLEGKVQIVFRGQEALTRRLKAYDEDDAGRRKQVEDEVEGWLSAGATVEIQKISNWESSEEPLQVECKVSIPNLTISTGRRLLLPAAIFQVNRKHPFQQAQRVHPVYFDYPWQELDDTTIELPAQYQVESLPPLRKIDAKGALFEATAQSESRSLHFRRRFAMEMIIVGPQSYGALRSFYDQVKANDNEKVVLQAAAAAGRD